MKLVEYKVPDDGRAIRCKEEPVVLKLRLNTGLHCGANVITVL